MDGSQGAAGSRRNACIVAGLGVIRQPLRAVSGQKTGRQEPGAPGRASRPSNEIEGGGFSAGDHRRAA